MLNNVFIKDSLLLFFVYSEADDDYTEHAHFKR